MTSSAWRSRRDALRTITCGTRLVAAVLMMTASGVAACGDPSDGLPAWPDVPVLAATTDPVGPRILIDRVTFSGGGCRNDRFETAPERMANEQVLELAFSKFMLEMNRESPELVKQAACLVQVEFHTVGNVKLAVTRFATMGALDIEADVIAEGTVSYTFDGKPGVVRSLAGDRNPIRGPKQDPYLKVVDEVRETDQAWSNCRTKHVLQIKMGLKLTNSSPKRRGSISFAYAETTMAEVEVGMSSRSCESAS